MPGLRFGTGLVGIIPGVVTVDPPAQGAAGFFSFTITIPNARSGDRIILHPPNTLENTLRLVGYAITGDDTVTVRMEATAIVDGAALTWEYLLLDHTASPGVDI